MLRFPSSIKIVDAASADEVRWPHQYLQVYFRKLSIGKKIGFGYGAALAIAMLGSLAGMTWAGHHQQLAANYAEQIRSQTETIQRLQKHTLAVQLELLSLITYTDKSEQVTATNYRLSSRLKQVEEDLQGLQTAPENDEPYQQRLSVLIVDYAAIFEQYQSYIHKLTFDIDQILFLENNQRLSEAQRIKISANHLDRYLHRPVFEEFNSLPRRLNPILEEAQESLALSQHELANVERSSRQVTLWSFLLSTLLASVIAYFINRAITRPIRHLTFAARDSIQSANFDIQVPVIAEDEIGTLTVAVNEYINGVKQLLDERQATERQLIQSEKMSSLGQLVAGVAHEINNPVNFIHGNLEHLEQYSKDLFYLIAELEQKLKYCADDDCKNIAKVKRDIEFDFLMADLPKILDSLSLGTERIQTIVKGLRSFSRLDAADMKIIDIHSELENTLLILEHRLNSIPDLQVTQDYDKLPNIECYSGELNQVFLNILTNSIDALEEATSNQPHIGIQTRYMPSKDTVRISLKDNGPGIPEHIRDKIFNPFFTTKEVGKGTGLGMSISYQIITERHQGSLVCNSSLGKGTEFIIEIPVRQSVVTASAV